MRMLGWMCRDTRLGKRRNENVTMDVQRYKAGQEKK